jgi:UDP-N-acetylmuramyl tripeptide synthase
MDAQDRAAVTVPFSKTPDGLQATFAVIIAA